MFNKDKDFIPENIKLNGLFIGRVIHANDPKALERCFVRIFGIHDMENEDKDYGVWVNRLAPSKNSSGEIPEEGDLVYIMFLDPNDFLSGVWLGWVRVLK